MIGKKENPLDQFTELTNKFEEAKLINEKMEILRTKIKDTNTLIEILNENTPLDENKHAMLMLSFKTIETGRRDLKLDKEIKRGLIFGLNETVCIYEAQLKEFEKQFNVIINRN